MGETDSIVRATDLRKRYDTLTAVDGVSFEIRRGEIFGLLGPNGAGKTTTISMIAGILPATEGEIDVAGYDARRAGVAMKRAIGVVPQELALYPRLTARENLAFFGRLYGLQRADLDARADQMLELVGLRDRADSRADTYSGGMKRRLNLAIGLMHNPQVLLLDEPTVGVDPQSRNHIFEGVRKLNMQGLTILYSSHYMEEVEALCDRVGILDRGRLIACDTVPNLIASQGAAVIEVGIERTTPDPALLERLQHLEQVQSVEYLPSSTEEAADVASDGVGGVLRLRAGRPNLALPGLVTALTAARIPIHSLTIKEPNLEDVFLALTGKTLRD
jgi:ABC-2 type transport system ATP-binding protein